MEDNNNNLNYDEDMNYEGTDDNYLLELHNYLKTMKLQRKQAEQDANLLDGRLKCLRGEESKTLKKIEVTQRKTQNKLISLQQQEENLRLKMETKDRKKYELEEKKKMNQIKKDTNKMNILLKQEELRKNQETGVKMLKEQKKNNEELRMYLANEDISNKKTQAEYIKSQQIIAEEKRRAVELEKRNRIKMELEQKIFEEQQRIEDADYKRKAYEDEEIEMMKRIKATTQIHEAMVDNYEKLGSVKSNQNINKQYSP